MIAKFARTCKANWRWFSSEWIYKVWQITHPLAALREWRRLRLARKAARSRFEKFKAERGMR